MFLPFWKPRPCVTATLLACAVLFAPLAVASAGWPPPGVPSGTMPWELPKYLKRSYQQHQPSPRKPAVVTASPRRYGLHVNRVAVNRVIPSRPFPSVVGGQAVPVDVTEVPNNVLVIAHLPEDADVWFGDYKTSIQGTMRTFGSPSLIPGKDYTYTIRVAWPEEGRWVAQMHELTVRAGEAYCLDVSLPDEEEIAASLAKLEPAERTAALEQRYCPVQEGVRLGSMGTPVKLTLEGKSVFLCCQGGVSRAERNPKQTLETVEKLKAPPKANQPAP